MPNVLFASSGGARHDDTALTVPCATPGAPTLLYTDTVIKTAANNGNYDSMNLGVLGTNLIVRTSQLQASSM